ncbi:hypothetical protein LZ198_40960 [Myxococcus sp. K15C18031901]|uniref:hypothetical protein n=1 Tax=Myxococcus dinghuensis TaxID=2906761 RepID=UPI0020A7B520|nr:hypothetical protein [Myxococcus dinghuensis]MCP3105258.1 hypothetical protein [Myxococcus dinghuensis]
MRFHHFCLVVLSVLGATSCDDDGGEEQPPPQPQTENRVDPLLLGVLTVPGAYPVKVLTASVGMATPTNTLHHDYDDSVNGYGCNADHLDSAASPPDIYPGPVEGGIVTITGYTGGTLLDGSEAPKVITCKHFETPSPRYRCGYGPLTADGDVGPIINATPYPLDATPIRDGDVITFTSTGGGKFGGFPAEGQPPTTSTATGDLTASLGDVKFDPSQDTVIEVSCPGGCRGVATARTSVTRKTDPKTTSGGMQCLVELSPTNSRIVIKKEAIRVMRGCNLADGTNCDATLETAAITIVRFNPPNTSFDSKGNQIQNIAAGQGISATIPLKP